MSFEDEALRKTNSDVIQFDNIFSNDLAREQEYDLIFDAQEDEAILNMVESDNFFTEDGDEIVFEAVEDTMFLNEDDDEEEAPDTKDISSNDANGNGTDDDMEEPAKPAPSVQVDIDADNVNINAADDSTSVKEDGEVNVTAQVVNITPSANPVKTASDLASALGGNDTPAPVDAAVPPTDEPAPEPVQQPVNGGDDVATDDNDVEDTTDDIIDAPVEESVECVETPSDLENKLNAGLTPAPAPEETSPVNEPEDKSTEVVFGDYNDMEEKSDIYGEGTDIVDSGDPSLGDAPESSYNGIPQADEPEHKDTSEIEDRYDSDPNKDVEDAMTTTDDLAIESSDILPEDPKEEETEDDAKACLASIGPGLTAGDLGKMFDTASIEESGIGLYAEGTDVEDSLGDIDASVKVDEPEDNVGNIEDDIASANFDDEKATISGEEGEFTTGDSMWSDAQTEPHIADDSKVDAADDNTEYGDNMDAGAVKEESDDVDDWEDSLTGDDGEDDSDVSDDVEECKEEDQGVSSEDNEGGNTSDDDISSRVIDDGISDHSNDGNDAEIVDDKEQQGIKITDGGNFNGEEVCPHCGKKPCVCNKSCDEASLDAWVAEMAADSERIIPDVTEVPEEDMDPDAETKKQKGKYPGNDGSDPEVGTFAEDYQDIVDAQSDDDVFNPDINKGLSTTPEEEEPGSIEEEIDNEALDIALGLK